MGRIIYFPMKWTPSAKTQSELKLIQDWINETRCSIMVDCRFDKYQYTIRLQGMANMLRDKWKVIAGGNINYNAPCNFKSSK